MLHKHVRHVEQSLNSLSLSMGAVLKITNNKLENHRKIEKPKIKRWKTMEKKNIEKLHSEWARFVLFCQVAAPSAAATKIAAQISLSVADDCTIGHRDDAI